MLNRRMSRTSGSSRETGRPPKRLDDRVDRAHPPQRPGRDVGRERLVARVVEPLAGARQGVGKVGPVRRDRPQRGVGRPACRRRLRSCAEPCAWLDPRAGREVAGGERASAFGLQLQQADGTPVSRLDDEAVAADGEHLAGRAWPAD